jgi:hypothetical protein
VSESASLVHPRSRLIYALFAFGLLISVIMVLRSQTGTDQINLLRGGWILVTEKRLQPHGNPMSGGGYEPGGLTGFIVGLPLFIWKDYRAVNLTVLLTHVLAYALLDRIARDALTPLGRLLVCVVYWLNPWRLYFSAYLWNPNYLFMLGATHAWTAYKQRREPRFGYSLVHLLAVGFALQLHGSFLILAIASVLLSSRGYMKVHWRGAAAGALFIVLSLLPWLRAAIQDPGILPVQEGFVGRGLITVYPLLRGLLYWLRYPVISLSGQTILLDFTPALGAAADRVLAPVFSVLVRYVGPTTVALSLLANIRLWRRRPRLHFARFDARSSRREWLHGYARWCFVAAVIAFCLSPTTTMMWQGLIVMHAAVLPIVLWVEAMGRSRRARWVAAGVRAHTAALLLILLVISVAAPMYRRGGRRPVGFITNEVPPMVVALGILEHCWVVVDPEGPPGLRRTELLDEPP